MVGHAFLKMEREYVLLLHLFFISNLEVFVDRGRKNVSCPRAQGTLAMPLDVNDHVYSTSKSVNFVGSKKSPKQ